MFVCVCTLVYVPQCKQGGEGGTEEEEKEKEEYCIQ
jgi:hypothetical protein